MLDFGQENEAWGYESSSDFFMIKEWGNPILLSYK